MGARSKRFLRSALRRLADVVIWFAKYLTLLLMPASFCGCPENGPLCSLKIDVGFGWR